MAKKGKRKSYDDMVYTESTRPVKAPEGYKPQIVEVSEKTKKIMKETPIW